MKNLFCLLLLVCSFNLFAQPFDKDKLSRYLNALGANDKAMLSVAIVENGKPVYQHAIGFSDLGSGQKANKLTQYRIGSITKTYTATMIFQLIEAGKLSLDTTLDTFYPKVKNADQITISMLLNHRSGIKNFTDSPEYSQYMTQAKTKAEMINLIEDLDSDFTPDTHAKYSNSGYVLLGYIIEDITNETYAEQLNKRIAMPLGLDRTAYAGPIDTSDNQAKSYVHDATNWVSASVTDMSIPHGAGALVSTPTEVALFLSALLNGELLASDSLASMKEINEGFGRGLFQFPFYDKSAYGHNGGIDGFRSIAGHFDQDNVTVAITANGMNYVMNDTTIGILSIYYGLPFDIPDLDQKAIELSDTELMPFEGVFSSSELPIKITLAVQDGTLTAQATGQNPLNLTPYSNAEFRFDPAGIVILFATTDEIDYSTFVLQQGGGNFTFTRE